jgi:hypothetical protein
MQGEEQARRFAHPAFGAIALNRAADLAGRCEAHADAGAVVGPAQRLDRHTGARQGPSFGARQELPTFS